MGFSPCPRRLVSIRRHKAVGGSGKRSLRSLPMALVPMPPIVSLECERAYKLPLQGGLKPMRKTNRGVSSGGVARCVLTFNVPRNGLRNFVTPDPDPGHNRLAFHAYGIVRQSIRRFYGGRIERWCRGSIAGQGSRRVGS